MQRPNHPNTICMYTPSADGGHAQYVWELMTAMAKHPGGRFRYELVSSQDLEAKFKTDLYPVHPILPTLRHRNTYSSRTAWAISRITHYPRREMQFLRWLKGRPDISCVHLQEWKPCLAAPMIRRMRAMGKKVFYTVHNVFPHKYPRYLPKSLTDRWIRKACLMCDGLFVLTDLLAEELKRFLGAGHPPIYVVPHGVWTVSDAPPTPTIEERLSWKRLLFFGSIRRNKGLDLLLRAAEHLPGYAITIAGEPMDQTYYDTEIVPLVRKLQNAGMKIDAMDRFIRDDEIGPLFATHSAIVLPYTREFVAQSGVVYMALAYELPAVASEAGGLRDLFNNYHIGVTFREPTPQDLAAAVRRLYADDLRHGLLEQMRAAKRRFSWQEAARMTIAGYCDTQVAGKETEDDCSVQPNPAH